MYWNSYSVVVPEGKEHGGYVELSHGQVYTVRLKNDRDVRCDVQLEIDGQDIGTWRLNSHEGLTLERPAHDDGRFTFYKVGSPESQKAGLDSGNPNLGLVKAMFTPEKQYPPFSWERRTDRRKGFPYNPYKGDPYWSTYDGSHLVGRTYSMATDNSIGASLSANNAGDVPIAMASMLTVESQAKGLSAGGTGLSGKSDQQFVSTYALNYDYSQQTTIHLRLVHGDSSEPRPLTSHSTPIPPTIR